MAEARIDVQVEHKHAPPPAEQEASEHLPQVRVALPRRRARRRRSGSARSAGTTIRCARGRGSTWYADEGSFVEEAADVRSDDPLEFFDLRPYAERLAEAELNTGLGEAMVIGQATLDGHPVELAVMDFAFMGGSMGSAVGEKFSRACDSAAERGVPLVSVTTSGGARMQEGILSLMQLPKTVCAVEDLHDARRADDHRDGASDDRGRARVVRVARRRDDRRARRADRVHRAARRAADDAREAARGLRAGRAEPPLRPPRRDRPARRPARVPRARAEALLDEPSERPGGEPAPAAVRALAAAAAARARGSTARPSGSSASSSGCRRTRATRRSGARSSSRATPTGRTRSTTSSGSLDDWVELHGDRGRADDGALVTGLGSLDGRTIALVGHQKGRDVKERLDRQFGMAYPEGYLKAMRVMEIAERLRLPVRRRSSTRRARIRASPPSSTDRAARSPARRPRWRG